MDTEQANRIAELEKLLREADRKAKLTQMIREGAIENRRARLDVEANCNDWELKQGDCSCYLCQYYNWRYHKVEGWMYRCAVELHKMKGLPPPHDDTYLELYEYAPRW